MIISYEGRYKDMGIKMYENSKGTYISVKKNYSHILLSNKWQEWKYKMNKSLVNSV